MVTLLDTLLQSFQQLFTNFREALSSAPIPAAPLAGALGAALTLALHVLVAVLAVLIVWRCAASLLRGRTEEEHWGFFSLPNGAKLPLNHWENIIGRAASCDIVLSLPTVSRQHAAVQRDEDGLWTIYPLGGRGGVAVNGKKVNYQRAITVGDKVTVGGIDLYFFPASAEELRQQTQRRQRPGRRFRPTTTLAYLTAFQGLLLLELVYAKGAEFTSVLMGCFGVLCAAMWGLYALYRLFRRTGFELESLAFFLTSLCLCITASSSISTLPKQTVSVLLGLFAFVLLGLFLRDLAIAKKLRWPVAIAACALLAFNVLFGQQLFGARNWVSIGPLSFQPSEFVKVAFILAGAETMDRLFARRNLIFTILFSLFCVGCLALMSDFGTALIFFIAFLAIAFLRSGDLPSIAMICAAAAAGCGVVLKFKPYIANRFAAWQHVWEFADTTGYQQTRTMLCGRQRRAVWQRRRQRLAQIRGRVQHRPCVRYGGRRTGADRGCADSSMYCHVFFVHYKSRRHLPLHLLHHRRLLHLHYAGVSDRPECARIRGPAAPDGRNIPLPLLRRIQHDSLLGPAGFYQSRRQPPKFRSGRAPAGPEGRTDPLRWRRRSHAGI